VNLLTKEGFSVQLKHVEDEDESTRDQVCIRTEAGEELASHEDMQHNRNYRSLEDNAQNLVDKVKSMNLTTTGEASKVLEAANDSELSQEQSQEA
jgi:hypothetical protein